MADSQKRNEGKMARYEVEVQLSGNDGNAFAIMASVKKALVKAGATPAEVNQYLKESLSGDYDNLLRGAMDWVKVA
jgi:hypothetical protein